MAGTTPVLSIGSPLFCCVGATSGARVLCDLLVIFSASSESIPLFRVCVNCGKVDARDLIICDEICPYLNIRI